MKTSMQVAKKKCNNLHAAENRIAFLFVLPPILGFFIFTVGTMLFSIYFSFTNFNPVSGAMNFVAFKNYVDLFTSIIYSKSFFNSIFNTLFLLLGVPIGMVFGLGLAALLINKKILGNKVLRIIFYLPAVSSAVALNIVWRYIFNNEFGIINLLIGIKINWISDHLLVKIAIIIKNVWAGLGGTMILYLAGMLNISQDYYESADIDGAGGVQKFFKITLPMITPITFYLLIMGVIGGLQSYADSQVFAAGVEGGQTIVYFIWSRGINQSRYGVASAASLILAIALMIITIVQFKTSGKWVYEE